MAFCNLTFQFVSQSKLPVECWWVGLLWLRPHLTENPPQGKRHKRSAHERWLWWPEMRTTSNNDKKQMVWTKERITFFLLACFTRIQHIAWRSKSKHENAIDDQNCSHIIIGLPGLRLPPNIGTSYFYKWNIVFTCWREVCIWSEPFPMKLIAKLALFCPSESLLPGQVLEVRYPCDKPLASNTMPPFAFPDSTRANPLER